MKKILVGLFILVASPIFAQQATSNSKLGFDEVGQTSIVAQSATYKVYVDGASVGVILTNLTCTGTTTANCSVDFPPLTLGTHVITITQLFGTTESAKSSPFTFTFVVVVTPTNIRIIGS